MSDEAPDQESKTEDPSQKKLQDAFEKGDVVKSQEVNTWFVLAGSAAVFAGIAPSASASLSDALQTFIANADRIAIGGPAFGGMMADLFWTLTGIVLLPLGVLAAAALVANLVQHKFLVSTEPITPKLSKISPLAGIKRLFSIDALVNFGKGLAKLGLVGTVMVAVMWPERDRLDTMMTTDPLLILSDFQELGLKMLWPVLAVVTLIAAADYFYMRQKWWKRHMMTLQETRDEYKQMEGDPKIKGRIRQLRQERSKKRMMAAVPDATVVVTNPTHFAVALKYDRTMNAPQCVAKGADAVALRIREIAKEHDVPIVENPPLARALFASVEVDDTIPAEHFKAVAEVVGFVMRLKRPGGWRAG